VIANQNLLNEADRARSPSCPFQDRSSVQL
jgi:hypothetical protein